MAATSKTQLLNEVLTLLKKRYKLESRAEKLSVLEAIIYGICHEGSTRAEAEHALNRFRTEFFDWNEVRVSSIEEIQSILAGQPEAEERANRLRRFLRQLFEKTYEFTLDSLVKKPLKESVKLLSEYDAMSSDYVLATVIQQGLGGHAMPVDTPIKRALIRLGVVDESANVHAIRSLLEHAIPKTRGNEFIDLMEELAHDTCVAGLPDCPRCDLRKICPTGQARAASDKTAAKAATKAKPAAPLPPPPALPAKGLKKPAAKPAPLSKPAATTKVIPAAKSVAASPKSIEKGKPVKVDPKAKKAVPPTKAAKGRRPTSK
jgi:endonuclease III